LAFEVVRSRESDRDLDAIFDHLVDAHRVLGEPLEVAFRRAAGRIGAIEDDMERLGGAPFQGTLREDLMPGLRHVTKNRAIFYFLVDEIAAEVRVLAVFFGGQDHVARMLARVARPRK
jgi:plasmid stabilization system protein ParE